MSLKHNYLNKGLWEIFGLFGRVRRALYAGRWRETQTKLEHAIVLELVSEIREKLPRIGTPKLHFMLSENFRKYNIKMGRATLNDLLSAHGLLVRKKKRKPKTTNSNHWYRCYSNLILGRPITAPTQVWVSDISYVCIEDRFAYLSLLTDAYSRKILGYCLCPSLESTGPVMALRMALQTLQGAEGRPVAHYSDRGVRYCYHDYITLLNKEGLAISMTAKGDSYENAIAERINGILKSELGVGGGFINLDQAAAIVEQSILSYNQLRPSLQL